MFSREKKDSGFSLVELIVVVAIVAILATIAVPLYLNFRKRAYTTEARAGLHGIRALQRNYLFNNDIYADDIAKLDFKMEGTPRYRYEILGAGPWGFTAQASANLDGDSIIDVWTIDTKGAYTHVTVD
jgi:prepilin-type N-terminal cleavage/methylation domain-containing protein